MLSRTEVETLAESFLSSHHHRPHLADGDVRGSDLAYIIHTSGSTGLPKGVLLLHRGLNNLGVAAVAALGVRSDDRVSLLSSPAFDAWISDLAMAWTAGAAVVPFVRADMNDVTGMLEKLARLRVNVATMTPSYLRVFEQAEFPGLRLLMTVGEPPHPSDARHYAERLRYFNGYGPTESTAAASFGLIAPRTKRLTAGRPLVNTSVHILNDQGEPVPPGAVGLVFLGGMGLAAGYLNRPELTAASFVTTASGRLYRTGDAGRWTSTGELRILGRSDGQVKLRGQRVELGEIEHLLGDHPDARQSAAVVETHADGTQILWAFVCLRSGATEPTPTEWHDYLSKSLPSYMLPAAVLTISAMPVNTAGKVDRAALGRMALARQTNHAEADGDGVHGDPPRDGMEARVARSTWDTGPSPAATISSTSEAIACGPSRWSISFDAPFIAPSTIFTNTPGWPTSLVFASSGPSTCGHCCDRRRGIGGTIRTGSRPMRRSVTRRWLSRCVTMKRGTGITRATVGRDAGTILRFC